MVCTDDVYTSSLVTNKATCTTAGQTALVANPNTEVLSKNLFSEWPRGAPEMAFKLM